MIMSDEATEPVVLNQTRLLAVGLRTAGALLFVGTLSLAVAGLVESSRAGISHFWGSLILGAATLLFGGAAGGLVLWGAADVLRKLDDLLAALHATGRAVGRASSSDTTLYGVPFRTETSYKATDDLKAALQELVALTREVRDISLLSEPDRAARMQLQAAALVQELRHDIPALLHEHKWVEATRRVRRARERFPALPDWDALQQQIDVVRSSVEARDVENASRQLHDLIALGAWDRALALVRELLERHPHSPAAQELTRRVTLQREKADAEQRARLMSQAQDAVHRREWNQALSQANEILRRFPGSPEAEALRQQLPTLVENAEIQTRHRMEDEFRELMKQQRFQEALALAHELIDRYPKSPQAEVLREQMPRLEARVGAP